MMTTFTDWDIIRNLLLAGRWTVLLSLVAFVGGAAVTLPLLLLRLTVGFAVQVIKGTALASIIGFIELTKAGTMLTNVTYQPFKVFALVALGYFILCYPLSRYSRYLETKFNASHHH